MKQGVKFSILAVTLILLILAAVWGYRFLTARYQAPEQQTADEGNEEQAKTDPAPDFTVMDMDGNSVNLSDYFGKPIIINFWAAWCGPCKSELPAFDAAIQEYGQEITFLMVNLTDGFRDTVSVVTDFVDENNYSFPVYFDTEYSAAIAYRVSSIPLTVLIDRDGNLYKSHTGAMSDTILDKYIQELLEDAGQ
ncbi:MAG: TlpA family protein disulfide reductase [Acetatifactor sp.]|nr:TlpA family protein disulfide reductase [Acetatifactor sp.]